MTRLMVGIVIAFGVMPTLGLAQGPWSAQGVQQAGYHGQLPPHPGPAQDWHQPYGNDALTQYQLLPDDRGFLHDRDSRCDLLLGETISRSWVKFDYLLWDLKPFGNGIVGAPIQEDPGDPVPDLTGNNITSRVSAQDRVTGARAQTFITVPDFGRIDDKGLNGARLSLGIPTRIGTFEAEAFALEQSSEGFPVDPRLDTRNAFPVNIIPAVLLLNNGIANDDTMILFSESYRLSLATQVSGTEANWVFNPFDSAAAIQVSPSLGFRYFRLQDHMSISGSDIPDPLNAPMTILNHRITSRARNNVFGPQIGMKASTQIWKFTFDAETKFLLGINRIEAAVGTAQIFSAAELPTSSKDQITRFAPTLDLGLKMRVACTEHLSLHVGYDLLLGDGYSRAAKNVFYNAPANITDPPQIRLNQERSEFYAHGLSVGGELLFW